MTRGTSMYVAWACSAVMRWKIHRALSTTVYIYTKIVLGNFATFSCLVLQLFLSSRLVIM